jgi:alanyl-tRNA synthetase
MIPFGDMTFGNRFVRVISNHFRTFSLAINNGIAPVQTNK